MIYIKDTNQMPSLKMKTKSSGDSLKENRGLHVCQKSSKISKNSFSHARNFQNEEAELDTFTSNNQEIRSDETNCCEIVDEEILQFQKHISPSSNAGVVYSMVKHSNHDIFSSLFNHFLFITLESGLLTFMVFSIAGSHINHRNNLFTYTGVH